jgi:hypothetical protein
MAWPPAVPHNTVLRFITFVIRTILTPKSRRNHFPQSPLCPRNARSCIVSLKPVIVFDQLLQERGETV